MLQKGFLYMSQDGIRKRQQIICLLNVQFAKAEIVKHVFHRAARNINLFFTIILYLTPSIILPLFSDLKEKAF